MTTLYSRARGIGLLEVIVAIGIVALGAAMLLPSLCRSRETANRVKCASNLRQVGQALLLYSRENKGVYPRLRDFDAAAPITAFTGVDDDANPFDGANDPAPNDVTAVWFLLVRTQDLGTEVFTCPSSSAEKYVPTDAIGKHSNFPAPTHLSYAVTMPYVSDELAKAGYHWDPNANPEFVVAGDMGRDANASSLKATSPQVEIKKFNSANHDREGQNVLFGDGHVEFANTPFSGMNKDYVYAPADGKPGGGPQHPTDSVLLPLAKD